MKTDRFISEQFIEAENDDDARKKFADDSFYFASNAECEEVTNDVVTYESPDLLQ